ncbi:MAG: stage III sporulation protein AA, partial [Defluviitaleaceae bacterium]|nr:stage III sporulation protein AA [Defluviitaleaceae bacterium]
MGTKESIRAFMGAGVSRRLEAIGESEFERVTEIRLRVDKPMIIKISGSDNVQEFSPTAEDIRETMEKISQHSFYAFEAELSAGFITLPGGHRVGVSGQVVIENGAVKAWRYISGLNIRIAHSVLGCADEVLPHIFKEGEFLHTMVISPPAYGKTTLLRDIIRQISNGGLTVGLADERSEIAGCFRGIAQNDVGIRTDTLDGCPKDIAMHMLLRGMSPDVIAVDELGGEADARAVDAVLNAGVKLLCTAHGRDVSDVMANPALSAVLDRGIFERFIVLDKPKNIAGVWGRSPESPHEMRRVSEANGAEAGFARCSEGAW